MADKVASRGVEGCANSPPPPVGGYSFASRDSTDNRISLWWLYSMKARQLTFLILLNAVLIAAGFYYFTGKPSARSTNVSPEVTREKVKLPSLRTPPKISEPNGPRMVYMTNQFHWREVESGDYRKYIANLRAIGCPESTIKDIILTDILKLYSARRGQFYHNGREFKFWETDEKRKLNARQLEEREKQLAAIDKEIPAVLRDLLGINYEREINKYFVDTNEDERRLSFLPEDKRSEVLALRDEIEGMKERILEAANGLPAEAEKEALRKIEEQRKETLAKILSGSELAEFELRTSETADKLRGDLIGFNPSEAEFRQIYELQKAAGEKFADASSSEVAQKEIQDELKRQLGDARYAEYERAQNPDFRNACVFAEVYELPISTAQTIFDIKQIAEEERRNLLANSTVAERDQIAALKAIQTETEKSLRQTMGSKIFANYAQSTGRWIENLGAAK
ncbi:MAG: hypothetical protein ABIQ35_01970 [Verrucomicrobiota bacterium]